MRNRTVKKEQLADKIDAILLKKGMSNVEVKRESDGTFKVLSVKKTIE